MLRTSNIMLLDLNEKIMYRNKLTPEEALEAIKLRMKYDAKLTLDENKIVLEQIFTPPSSGALSGMTIADYAKKQQEKQTAQPKQAPQIEIPKELKDIEGVKDFQNWLDQNYPKWHEKYGTLKQSVVRGFGKFGPRTSKWWKSVGEDFLNIRNTKDRKHAERIVLSDGNTLVWDGKGKKWLSDSDFLKIYNNDGSFKVSIPKTQINKPQITAPDLTAKIQASPSVRPSAPPVAQTNTEVKATKEVGF